MLARETDQAFDDPEWIYEVKWDGYRALADIRKDQIILYSRNGNTFNGSYPIVVQELDKIKTPCLLDGEIVVLNDKGLPDFQLLQDYAQHTDQPILYYVFDLLREGQHELYDLPLLERKKRLSALLPQNAVIRYSDHFEETGMALFREARKKGMEGIMAKRADSRYFPGTRTSNWLKIKNHHTAEAIIAGYTEPGGSRKYFGALLLGIKEKGKLRYAGHTGSGFNSSSLKDLYRQLQPLITEHPAFDEPVKTNMPATWVKPVLVCEVKFTEWTKDGRMRHPIFLHLRPDKPAKEVTMAANTMVKKKDSGSAKKGSNELTFKKIKVTISHPDKLFWPEEKITKKDVVDYYQSVSSFILPYLKGRPESLKRNPNGISDKGFFHKDAGGDAPSWVKSKKIFSESANKDIDYILCEDAATLAYLNNLGCIEINPWHSTVGDLDHPDYLIIDIDPSAKNSFGQVIETAQVIHEVLESWKVPNFCKTSGATGLHIYIPAGKRYSYDQLKDFAELVCRSAHAQLPGFTSTERNLKKRGNKIYLDHLQNRRGQTIASVYSLRPMPGATVSAPLDWKEVKEGLSPQQFNIFNMKQRIEKKGDIFRPVLGKGFDLGKVLRLLAK